MKKVKVTQKENELEVITEVTAQAIVEISSAIKKLRSGRLKDRTIVLLIKANCPYWVGIVEIKAVLDGMATLEKELLK